MRGSKSTNIGNTATPKGPERVACPIGLPNIGNTCFLNSIIQFLYPVKQMRGLLIQKYGQSSSMKGAKFAKLIGKLFFILQQRSKEQQKTRQILALMMGRLQSINTQYSRYSQEDALQTLLSILLQIEEKHPDAISIFDIDYEAACFCSSFATRERVLSISQNICVTCNKPLKRLLCKPQYLIYSNPSKKPVNNQKIQEFSGNAQAQNQETSRKLLYILVAQILYSGSGKSGHYIANRIEQDKTYQFNDSSVRQININNKNQAKNRGLILLYELQSQSIATPYKPETPIEVEKIYELQIIVFLKGSKSLACQKKVFVKIFQQSIGQKKNYFLQILNKFISPYIFYSNDKFSAFYSQLKKQSRNQQRKFAQYVQEIINERIKNAYKSKKLFQRCEIKFIFDEGDLRRKCEIIKISSC